MFSRHDQPGDVGDIGHHQCLDRVGDLPDPLEIDDPGVGRSTTDDEPGAMLLGELLHRLVVDLLGLRVHPIGHDIEVPAAVGEGMPVGQMPAMGQIHPHDHIARLEHGEVDRHVRLGSRVRLDVRVLCAEEFLRSVDRQALDDVGGPAAPVVASAGIALRVLIGEYRAHRSQHRPGDVILRGDQLESFILPLRLQTNGIGDLCIDGVQRPIHAGVSVMGIAHGSLLFRGSYRRRMLSEFRHINRRWRPLRMPVTLRPEPGGEECEGTESEACDRIDHVVPAGQHRAQKHDRRQPKREPPKWPDICRIQRARNISKRQREGSETRRHRKSQLHAPDRSPPWAMSRTADSSEISRYCQ